AGPVYLYLTLFCIGASSMPIYALCIATASDNAEVSLIQIASGILIMNSLGSIIGPLVVSPLMGIFGGPGFFLYTMVCFALATLWALYRIAMVERPREHEHRFENLPKTTPVIAELSQEAPLTEADYPADAK
ncbi:MAG: hypothetical protein R3E86_16150, partial [Pseudomonadales bacterium]